MSNINQANEERLKSLLSTCSTLLDTIRDNFIREAAKTNSHYSEEEEWYLERMDEAIGHVKKAQFAVSRSNFKANHEV